MVIVFEGEIFERQEQQLNQHELIEFASAFLQPERLAFILKDDFGEITGALSLYDVLENRMSGLGYLRVTDMADAFVQARDLFYEKGALENQLLPCLDENGKYVCILQFLENRIFGEKVDGTIYDTFADYDIQGQYLDLSLLRKYDSVVLTQWEEYTACIAKVCKMYMPEKKVYCLDANAGILGADCEIRERLSEIEETLSKGSPGRILFVVSERQNEYGSIPRYLTGVYNSLCVMKSLFWCAREECMGSKNPDKRILLLDYDVQESGLVDSFRFGAIYCGLARDRGFEVVMDCRDARGYLGGSATESFWQAYFQPVSSITVEEAYESAHVFRASVNGIRLVDWEMNPYVFERDCIQWDQAKAHKETDVARWIRVREDVLLEIENALPQIFSEKKKIMGVVARGSDYRKEAMAARGSSDYAASEEAVSFLADMQTRFELGGFDAIYLATEDKEYLQMFLSVFGEKVWYQKQQRVDPFSEEQYGKSVAELLNCADNGKRNRDYLQVLVALSKCDVLFANMDCGAYLAGLALL